MTVPDGTDPVPFTSAGVIPGRFLFPGRPLMLRKIVITLMVIILVLLFYMIFNMGNPSGLQRYLIKDPGYDLWLLIGLGVSVFILSLLLMRDNERRRDRQ